MEGKVKAFPFFYDSMRDLPEYSSDGKWRHGIG